MSLYISPNKPDAFVLISNALADTKIKSKSVTELFKCIQNVEESSSITLDPSTLTSRITLLEKLSPRQVLPERRHFYLGIKAYDQARAKKILNKKQELSHQYLTQLFACIDKDPSRMDSLLEILKVCGLQNLRSILIYARQKKHLELVKQCSTCINGLDHDNSYSSNEEQSALLSALHNHHIEAVHHLLAQGAHVNFFLQFYFLNKTISTTLLGWLFYHNAWHFAQTLINAGADINLKNSYGKTTLMVGACSNQLDLVNILINAKADLNLQDAWGYTALTHAVLHSDVSVSLALMRAGANPDLQIFRDRYKPAVLQTERIRAEKNQLTVAEVGDTALTLAASTGQKDLVSTLIQARAYLNSKTETGRTALMRAIINLQSECAVLLIDAGADLNLKANSGHTALMLAILKDLPQVASCLIRKKVALNVQLYDGRTALMLAIEKNQIDSALKLIQAGANWALKANPESDKPPVDAFSLAQERRQFTVLDALSLKRDLPRSILGWMKASNALSPIPE